MISPRQSHTPSRTQFSTGSENMSITLVRMPGIGTHGYSGVLNERSAFGYMRRQISTAAQTIAKYTDYEQQLESAPPDVTEEGEDVENQPPREPLDEETYRDVKRWAMAQAEPIVEGWRHPPAAEPDE